MNSGTKMVIGLMAVLIFIVVGLFLLYGTSIQPHIESFAVEQNKLVAITKNVSSLELWATPTGTGITDEDHTKVGALTLTSANSNQQMWQIEIPKDPMLITDMYVKAFNKKGEEVALRSLGYTGATEIYNALWGTSTPATSSVPKTQQSKPLSPPVTNPDVQESKG